MTSWRLSGGLCDDSLRLSYWGIGFIPMYLVPVEIILTSMIAIWQRRHRRSVITHHMTPSTLRLHDTSSLATGRLVVLPMYSVFLFVTAIADALQGATLLIDPWVSIHNALPGHIPSSIFFGIQFALYHLVNEGVVISLLRQSAGRLSLRRASIQSVVLALVIGIYLTLFAAFSTSHIMFHASLLALECVLTIFFLIVVFSPLHWLYRRPSVNLVARVTLCYRVMKLITGALRLVEWHLDDVACVETGMNTVFQFVKPFLVFHALLADSDFWKGLSGSSMGVPQPSDIRAPLLGVHITSRAAGLLAREMDGLPMLSHAFLQLGQADTASDSERGLLGVNGTSRMYRGTYDGQLVAIKLLFCMELTPSLVTSFAQEANKMNSMSDHPNVIRLLGVCVCPPSLALIMEPSSYGSLYSLLHPPVATTPALPLDDSINSGSNSNSNSISNDGSIEEKRSTTAVATNNTNIAINNPSATGASPSPSAAASPLTSILEGAPPPIRLTPRNRMILAWQAAKGVAHLHSYHPPVLHLALSTHAFLVSEAAPHRTRSSRAHSNGSSSHSNSGSNNGSNGSSHSNSHSSQDGSVHHRRIKPIPFELKLADVGLSLNETEIAERAADTRQRDRIYVPNSIHWTAPELFTGGDHTSAVAMLSTKSDCFSLGMVMYEIATDIIPYATSRTPGADDMLRSTTMRDIAMGEYRPAIPSYVDTRWAALIYDLWKHEPNHRPSAADAADRLRDMLAL